MRLNSFMKTVINKIKQFFPAHHPSIIDQPTKPIHQVIETNQVNQQNNRIQSPNNPMQSQNNYNLIKSPKDAANNFARGHYTFGKEIIDKEQGFVINHAVGAGIGSELGALILQRIAV